MKSILIPTDFSPNATKALDFATRIARRANASIIIINACNMVDSLVRERTAIEKKFNLPIEEATLMELEELKTTISQKEKLKVETQMYGLPVMTAILEANREYKPDLVVMGTLGNTGLKEKLFGSVTAELIGKSDVPVLAVPILSEWHDLSKILLAVNKFDQDTELADPVFELGRFFDAKITVAVFTDERKDEVMDYVENTRGILNYLERLRSRHTFTIIHGGEIYGHGFEKMIDSYVNANEIDMLAMFTHKRSFIESIFNSSMTKKMSYHTNIPLLAVPVR